MDALMAISENSDTPETIRLWFQNIVNFWIESCWCYLYRAIDKSGNLIDIYLISDNRSATVEVFFKVHIKTTGILPKQITIDKEPALSYG